MFDFHERRKIRSWLYSKTAITFILVLTLWLAASVFERYQVEREMAAKREAKEVELAALSLRAEALEEKVDHLLDERGIEEELRNRFDVAKEGEQVIILVDDTGASDTDLDALKIPPGQTNEESSFWDFFKFW